MTQADQASPDVREVLEAAWLAIHHEGYLLENEQDTCRKCDRFTRFLDAEAYTDAALMLVPVHCRVVTMTEHVDRQGWYVKLAIHSPHEALEAVTDKTLPLAICAAALRAKGPGHER